MGMVVKYGELQNPQKLAMVEVSFAGKSIDLGLKWEIFQPRLTSGGQIMVNHRLMPGIGGEELGGSSTDIIRYLTSISWLDWVTKEWTCNIPETVSLVSWLAGRSRKLQISQGFSSHVGESFSNGPMERFSLASS